MLKKLACMVLLVSTVSDAATLSDTATATAQYARATYGTRVVDALAALVSFNTVADPKVAFEKNPQMSGFKKFLKAEAGRLGFDYRDDGYIVVIGYGSGEQRLGMVTHGDVQPVDSPKWKQSPFKLDRSSEPGLLLARGAEDDKGPIATALYAMKAIKDRQLKLSKRIELYVYMGEESDWEPLQAWLKTHTPPQVNITLDAEYPVVTAEKGWGMVNVTMPAEGHADVDPDAPRLVSFTGGFFAAQIPEDASATIDNAPAELEAQIAARARQQQGMRYQLARAGKRLTVVARGHAAHSSKPWEGVNAIGMLADALAVRSWSGTQAGNMADFVAEMIGTGFYAERFGDLAYADEFMGPLTAAPTLLQVADDKTLSLDINLRRPRGRTGADVEQLIRTAVDAWSTKHAVTATVATQLEEPWVQEYAPHVPVLLNVFSVFTGTKDAKPIAIGGATNSRLFPAAVSFGPTMPGHVYSGHSEHEFISEEQLLLNLQMYTAALVELAR